MTRAAVPDFESIIPDTASAAFVAKNATIIGDVTLGAGASVWYNAVLRGDVEKIRIGADTNVQDGAIIHVSTGGQGTHVGARVTIGHMALLHDCTVMDDAYIGMQACIMDGAVIESGAFVAAGALVTPAKRVPSGQLWAGRPAKYVRDLNADDRKVMDWSAPHYVALARRHAALHTGK